MSNRADLFNINLQLFSHPHKKNLWERIEASKKEDSIFLVKGAAHSFENMHVPLPEIIVPLPKEKDNKIVITISTKKLQ